MRNRWNFILAIAIATYGSKADAFQIAPLGSKFEARLTNEKESRLAKVAGSLGVLIKLPVHEEITQLGFGCPVDRQALLSDDSCTGGDAGFANHFIIYGVRWNDLPPFRLSAGQGDECKKLGFIEQHACNVQQTVRFSTQPDCWYCLFRQAEKRAVSKRITGCEKGKFFERGNLMTRSHFGDLQFLHSMERDDGTSAYTTQRKILDWLQFAWAVFTGELTPDTYLKDIRIATIKEHFACSEWTVSDLYILGRNESLRRRLSDIAFGSVLHTLQDSFAAGHVTRELPVTGETCPTEPNARRPGRIVEFHTYGMQDTKMHDERDSRSAMVDTASQRWPEAVDATTQLFRFYDENAPWEKVRPYLECVFEISPKNRPSSAGIDFKR